MTHIGEKLTLGSIGGLGGLFGRLQSHCHPLALDNFFPQGRIDLCDCSRAFLHAPFVSVMRWLQGTVLLPYDAVGAPDNKEEHGIEPCQNGHDASYHMALGL